MYTRILLHMQACKHAHAGTYSHKHAHAQTHAHTHTIFTAINCLQGVTVVPPSIQQWFRSSSLCQWSAMNQTLGSSKDTSQPLYGNTLTHSVLIAEVGLSLSVERPSQLVIGNWQHSIGCLHKLQFHEFVGLSLLAEQLGFHL